MLPGNDYVELILRIGWLIQFQYLAICSQRFAYVQYLQPIRLCVHDTCSHDKLCVIILNPGLVLDP
jgi:hypothetical protein